MTKHTNSATIQASHPKAVDDTTALGWLFNPGYEPSVALGASHYTPPKQVQAFRRDLAALPIYLARRGDQVIIPDELQALYREECFTTELQAGTKLSPWGWAPELSDWLPEGTPLPYTIEEMRYFTSRACALDLWHLVYNQGGDKYPLVRAPLRLSEWLSRNQDEGAWVLKEDYSSSGRGILFLPYGADTKALIAKRVGRRPLDHFYIEPYYPKVKDRGYEFFRTSTGEIQFIGGSDFTTAQGRYIGNRIVKQETLLTEWVQQPTLPTHDEYLEHLTKALQALPLGSYCGYLGVDTLLFNNDEGQLYIVPAIEINVRPTMGHLAIAIGEKYLHKGRDATFSIQRLRTTEERVKAESLAKSKPPLFQCHDLQSGTYPLIHYTLNTLFTATVTLS